jgi:hypothetical protein
MKHPLLYRKKHGITNIYLCIVLIILSVIPSLSAKSQDTTKQNPVVFAELLIGHAYGAGGGFSLGAATNFQTGKNLFTFRYVGTLKLKAGLVLFIIPFFEESRSGEEFALLYGRRFIKEGTSSSFSLGVSYNLRSETFLNATQPDIKESYVGVPFEANIKFFKAQKKRYRIIYGLIPVGKPTGFGRSIGLKFFGAVSKNSFAGLGLTSGLGFHKKY